MKKLAMAAALAGGFVVSQTGWTADARAQCYSQSAIEAEQAIRISDRCHAREYGLSEHDLCGIPPAQQGRDRRLSEGDDLAFPRRSRLSTAGTPRWPTPAAQKQATVNLGVFCQQAETLMKQAKALDPTAFRAYAASQAATAGAQYAKCGGDQEVAARRTAAIFNPPRPRA